MKQLPLPEFSQAVPVCGPGELPFASVGLEHGHIYGQTSHLAKAGGTLRWVYDPDAEKVRKFREIFPEAKPARSLEEVLDDPAIRLVTAAPISSDRASLGEKVMLAGKDYFVDKPPLTTLEQLAKVREIAARTGRKYVGSYSERLNAESSVVAERLVAENLIGDIVQIIGLGPHKLNAATRPAWFFQKPSYGGILVDIGSHQTDQFLAFTGAKDARVTHAAVANMANPGYPELEDFGEASLVDEKGRRGYFRVDWFTPRALPVFGDGRTIIMGTAGTIEIRKYIDIGKEGRDHVYLVNDEGHATICASGLTGLPFYGRLILDCLNRTENAMTQQHSFAAAELCIRAQMLADTQRET